MQYFIALDFTFTTRCIHTWALFLLWPSHFILSGAISNCPLLFPSSIIGHDLSWEAHHPVSDHFMDHSLVVAEELAYLNESMSHAIQDRPWWMGLSEEFWQNWSTGGGVNEIPLQYPCLKNPMNSMKREKDMKYMNTHFKVQPSYIHKSVKKQSYKKRKKKETIIREV